MQTLGPLGRQLAPTKWYSPLSHTQIWKDPNSENGKAHQPEVQVAEITTVVKIWLSWERHASHQHFHTIHEVLRHKLNLYDSQAKAHKLLFWTATTNHILSKYTFQSNYKVRASGNQITCPIQKNNYPNWDVVTWNHPHVGSGVCINRCYGLLGKNQEKPKESLIVSGSIQCKNMHKGYVMCHSSSISAISHFMKLILLFFCFFLKCMSI